MVGFIFLVFFYGKTFVHKKMPFVKIPTFEMVLGFLIRYNGVGGYKTPTNKMSDTQHDVAFIMMV